MNQINGENNTERPPNFPAKRGRGRPRKDPTQGITRRVTTHVTPPGQDRVNGGTHTLQLDAIEDSYNGVVGQPVTGVVESSFEAGYLLSVRIGNSSTNLRGVVFKPGHYVPISAENDVAPHVQMIRRNEISLPLQARSRGRHRRSRGRNARHVPGPELSLGSRGNMVPVVLQSVNQTPQVGQYEDPPYVHSQPGGNSFEPLMGQSENGNFSMSQGGPSASHVAEGEVGMDGNLSGEESDDVDEPLDVMPLQAVHRYVHSQQSQQVHKPMEVQRVGKMTELLQAVQENVPGNSLLGAENLMTRNDNAQA